MTFRLHGAVAGAAACTALLAACGSSGTYFMVREPGSATPYYTTTVSTSGSAVKFKDAKTGSGVTLQSSEVKKISKEEFTQAITASAPTPAAIIVPVPAATVGAQSPAATPLPAGAGASAPATVVADPAAPQVKPQ